MKNILTSIMLSILLLSSLSSNMLANEKAEANSVNGAEIWADVCMRCHNVRAPSDLSKRAWKFSMNHMRVRAGLTGQETRDVFDFIIKSKTLEDAK